MTTAGSWISATVLLLATIVSICGQRITTIQLDGVQYFISRMNPYSPELNYFLAYQYCRSIGLQLASFESKEKADSMAQYLINAGYNGHDYWTSGNRLGTDMLIWMSSGATFNATFDYMRKAFGNDLDTSTNGPSGEDSTETGPSTSAKPVSARWARHRQGRDSSLKTGCVTLKAPDLEWDTDDCEGNKDFICEQTRCYYYNYGSIPVSTSQGNNKVNKPTKETTTEETDSTNVTSVPRNNSNTPLGPLLNFTINRHITLRPNAHDVQTSQQSSTPAADLSLGGNPAARAVSDRDTDNNVVYVTAIGANNDQQAVAYVNMNAGFNADQISNVEITTKKANDKPNIGLLNEDDLSTTISITTSKITH
ncbi:uncharacterized protein LOC110832829 [Zootermopsis nevadensis]|uniref:Uncharacterized protein n=1 Tax=Zootermopsis nevadensis TaxID=136037 RepID=A0A067RC39_ZOONE|nr:uncharacterized protein LOC110832829 [Zootermopsis nevadensis]KDR16268.1 hypothetical protein L798_09687 [Zootermopsis nevadensis]